MADFNVPDDVRLVQNALRDFVEREVNPLEKKHAHLLADERHMLTDEGLLHPDLVEAVKHVRKQSAEAGYYAMHMPQEEGGGGMSKTAMYYAWKEVMRHGLGLNFHVLSFVEGPTPLFLRMNDDQKRKWLHPMIRGDQTSAFCLTEPGAGSDVSRLETTARKEGGEYVLNGTKTFVTNGPYADFLQVFAKTDAEAGLGGLSCFIVPTDAPGVHMSKPQVSISADGAQCEFNLQDVRVPEENLVGEEGEGFWLAIGNIGDTRVSIGGLSVGLAEYCLEHAVDYCQQREAFGKPIGKQGQIQRMLADSATEIFAAENMCLRTSWMIDQGQDVMKESSMVKLYTTEMLFRVADRAIQVHGGNGLMRELPLERVFRFARMLRIPEGTSEIQRWTIAKALGV